MNLNEILVMIAIGAIILVIGLWVILYYATLKHEDYHGYDDERPEFTEEEKKKLSLLAKNQDDDVPF